MSRLLERLKTDILVADGAMGTLLYANGLDNCYEAYNLIHPEKVSAIHKAYIEAGADVIQTKHMQQNDTDLRDMAMKIKSRRLIKLESELQDKLLGRIPLFWEQLVLFVV